MSDSLNPKLGTALNDGTLGLIGVAILLVTFVLWSSRSPNVEKTDFAMTYVGAHIMHEGMGSHLYDHELQVRLRDSMFQHASPLYFEHPPFEALGLSRLAVFPFRTAYLIWGLLNTSIVLWLIVWLRPHLKWPSEDLGYLALWLIFAPIMVAIYQGQSSIIVLAAFATSFLQLKKGNSLIAGAILGLALVKFQFAGPMAVIFMIRKQWRFVFGFAGTAMVLSLLSIAAVGGKGILDYVRFLAAISGNPHNVSYGSAVDMPTLHGLVFALGGRHLGGVGMNIVSALVSIAVLVWVALRGTHTGGSGSNPTFAAATAASLLSGAHMFTHDFSPLLLGLFLVGAALHCARQGLRIFTKLTLIVFWTFPLYFLLVNWHCLYVMAMALLVFTWCSLEVARSAPVTITHDLQSVTAG